VVICLQRDADLHMAQLMPLLLTVSSFSKIQNCFTFLVPGHPSSPGEGPLNGCALWQTLWTLLTLACWYKVMGVAVHSGDAVSSAGSAFLYIWVVSAFASTCYTFIWDVRMDWGLFDKNAGDNRYLREEIVYSRKVSLCWACDIYCRVTSKRPFNSIFSTTASVSQVR